MNGFNFNANITHTYELSFNVSTVDFNPLPIEWLQCKHYWDPKCVHSSLKLAKY